MVDGRGLEDHSTRSPLPIRDLRNSRPSRSHHWRQGAFPRSFIHEQKVAKIVPDGPQLSAVSAAPLISCGYCSPTV
jgi:hypothetical protein